MAAATGALGAQGPPGPAGVAARLAGFIGHLRLNGFALGHAETLDAIDLVQRLGLGEPLSLQTALKVLLTGRPDEWQRFDALFEAWWRGRGRRRAGPPALHREAVISAAQQRLWGDRLAEDAPGHRAPETLPGRPAGEDARDRPARCGRTASPEERLRRADLRRLVDPDELAAAEQVAYRLACALRHRLSRRWRASAGGARLDLRRTIRRSLGRGGEPIDLVRRRRPQEPVRLVVLLDVSGSMRAHARLYLAFVRGLAASWARTDVWLFHTRLMRVTDVLGRGRGEQALARLGLIAEGFGSGTRIGHCLEVFARDHAKRAVDGRTVLVILSDGYDTEGGPGLATALQRLRRRVPRLVWLCPLDRVDDLERLPAALRAGLPWIDHLASAVTLDGLAALERPLGRL